MSDTNQDVKLKLSLLLDNRLEPEDHPELLERLTHDRDLRTTWARYSMIGDVIRAQKSELAGESFALRVSQAIELDEAPPLAVLSERRLRRPHRHPRVNARAAWALAASIAGFALVMDYSETNPGLSRVDLVLEQNHSGNDQYQEETAEARFDDYLMTHNEVSYLTGSNGMLPHARLVSSPGR